MIFSAKAWESLFGRTATDLAGATAEVLRYLEQRLLFLRLTLIFGWVAEDESGMGKICVWDVVQ